MGQLALTEREKMITENLKLVHYLVRKMKIPANSCDYEDLVSIGTIGLIKAVDTYDVSKNSKFATYAATCIKNQIYMHFRQERNIKNTISLDDAIHGKEDEKKLALKDIIPSDDPPIYEIVEEVKFAEILNIIINALKPQKSIVMLYRLAGLNQMEIAKTLGVSQPQISRIVIKAIQEIKENYYSKQSKNYLFRILENENKYIINFSVQDIKKFDTIFFEILLNIRKNSKVPSFTVVKRKKLIMIIFPNGPKGFYFIAKFMEEIQKLKEP